MKPFCKLTRFVVMAALAASLTGCVAAPNDGFPWFYLDIGKKAQPADNMIPYEMGTPTTDVDQEASEVLK